jgi:NitT/TauT family transport system ATP-binding protein
MPNLRAAVVGDEHAPARHPEVVPGLSGPKIRLHQVEKTFVVRGRRVEAVQPTSFDIPDGQFVCLVGPSGCGKTTLLRIVAGLEELTSGSIEVRRASGDRPINSMIFQQESLFPWKTVWENVEFAMRVRGVPRDERRARTQEWLSKVGLQRFGNAYPYQLSGGMKQRVSIARAFANDPEILLMDEPFAALDQQTKLLLQDELIRIWIETRKTVIFVTHSIDEAVVLGDRIIVMTAHPGRVKAEVTVDLPRPRDPMEIRSDPRYVELTQDIWHELRDEVLRARAQEEGLE